MLAPLSLVPSPRVAAPEPLLARALRAWRQWRWRVLAGGRPRLVPRDEPRPQPLRLLA